MEPLLDRAIARRILYLVPNGAMHVRREATALRVESGCRAAVFYPVRRLSRVISRPGVDWQGAAIRLLMDESVPLLFVDEDGRALGLCLGARGGRDGLQAHLESAIAAPTWPEAWHHWYRSEERRILLYLAAALGWPTSDLQPRLMRALVDQALAEALGASRLHILRPLLAYCRAQVAEALAAAEIDVAVSSGLRGGVAIDRELGVLAGWTLRGRVIAAPPAGDMTTQGLAAYYALHLGPRLASTVRRLVARLWRLRLA